MKKRLREETFIILSVIKWVVLASFIGCIVGTVTAFFLKLLHWSISFFANIPFYYFLLPVSMIGSYMLVRWLAPEATGDGTDKVIESIHKRNGRIAASVIPVKLISTIMTIACGGSAGKEGPCAQIGAGLASVFSSIFKFDDYSRRKLVICGISAGFASVFGTPIAGAIFGVEVLFVGSILYDILLPSFVAGIIGFQVASYWGISYLYHPIDFKPVFTHSFFLEVIIAGVFFGICSFILIECIVMGDWISKRIRSSGYVKAIVAGLVLVLLALVSSPKYLGLGLDTIDNCLLGKIVPWDAFLLKSLFTSITLNFGGSGGTVTPMFFVGASAGNIFAQIFHLDIATFSAIGIASVTAGASNTPIAASILAIELFGPQIAPYAALASVISFFVTGHRSIHPSQILAMKKTSTVDIELGKALDTINLTFDPRSYHLERRILTTLRRLRNLFIRKTTVNK